MKNVIIRIKNLFVKIDNWIIKRAQLEDKIMYHAWLIKQEKENLPIKVRNLEERIKLLEQNLMSL